MCKCPQLGGKGTSDSLSHPIRGEKEPCASRRVTSKKKKKSSSVVSVSFPCATQEPPIGLQCRAASLSPLQKGLCIQLSHGRCLLRAAHVTPSGYVKYLGAVTGARCGSGWGRSQQKSSLGCKSHAQEIRMVKQAWRQVGAGQRAPVFSGQDVARGSAQRCTRTPP